MRCILTGFGCGAADEHQQHLLPHECQPECKRCGGSSRCCASAARPPPCLQAFSLAWTPMPPLAVLLFSTSCCKLQARPGLRLRPRLHQPLLQQRRPASLRTGGSSLSSCSRHWPLCCWQRSAASCSCAGGGSGGAQRRCRVPSVHSRAIMMPAPCCSQQRPAACVGAAAHAAGKLLPADMGVWHYRMLGLCAGCEGVRAAWASEQPFWQQPQGALGHCEWHGVQRHSYFVLCPQGTQRPLLHARGIGSLTPARLSKAGCRGMTANPVQTGL